MESVLSCRTMNIFLDMDETLLHTNSNPRGEYDIEGWNFDSTKNPDAEALIEYARSKVGKDNVFILTYGARDYALCVLDALGFDFDPEKVIAREEIQNNVWKQSCGRFNGQPRILIDNETVRFNEHKMIFLGLDPSDYFQCEAFYGCQASSNWLELNKEFIDERVEHHK